MEGGGQWAPGRRCPRAHSASLPGMYDHQPFQRVAENDCILGLRWCGRWTTIRPVAFQPSTSCSCVGGTPVDVKARGQLASTRLRSVHAILPRHLVAPLVAVSDDGFLHAFHLVGIALVLYPWAWAWACGPCAWVCHAYACMREECVYACMRLAILFAESKTGEGCRAVTGSPWQRTLILSLDIHSSVSPLFSNPASTYLEVNPYRQHMRVVCKRGQQVYYQLVDVYYSTPPPTTATPPPPPPPTPAR